MKKFKLTILVLAMIISAVNYQAIAKNKTRNPGFELGNGTDADDWTQSSEVVKRSSFEAHSGSYSMEISDIQHWGWQYAAQNNTDDYVGKWAALSTFLMTPPFEAISNSRAIIQMKFLRSDGVDDWRELQVQADSLSEGSWTQVFVDGSIVPDTTTNILITFMKESTNDLLYFDDVNLNVTDDYNPSFERHTEGWPWYWWKNDGHIERSETIAHTGVASLKIFGSGLVWPCSEQPDIPAFYDQQLEIDMYAYTPSSDPLKVDATLQLVWSDGTDEVLTALSSNSVEDCWVHTNYTVFVPVGVTNVDVRPHRWSPTEADDGTVYFDDVDISISPVPEPVLLINCLFLFLIFYQYKTK